MTRLRPCIDCGTPAEGTRCPTCQRDRDAQLRRRARPAERRRDRDRDKVRGTARQRGYGAAHEAARARLAPDVEAGRAHCAERICLEPDRWIPPGTSWDLAHDRTRPGEYLGPAHARCNRAEGARHTATRRTPGPENLA